MQVIFHIDIDAFFAAAEISKNPSLANKPLVIAGNSKRSVITTASYEARKFGIHSAMPLFQAKKLCKDLINRPVNMELYRSKSAQFFSVVSRFSSVLEVASIDECYVDMTSYIVEYKILPYELAKMIQDVVLDEIGLSISIGIAPNKFLAKMASDIEKPKGITVVTKNNFKEIMWPLPIKDMHGIGKKTQPKLIANGFITIKDIADKRKYDVLRSLVGKNALVLFRKANGIDQRKVQPNRSQLKSVGNSTTLSTDTDDIDIIYETIKSLAKSVSSRAIKKGLISNTIAITIKYTRIKSVSRQTVIDSYVNDYETVLATAKRLFDEHYNNQPLRLVGITLQNVIDKKKHYHQTSIFDSPESTEISKKDELIIELTKKHGENTIIDATSLIKKRESKY